MMADTTWTFDKSLETLKFKHEYKRRGGALGAAVFGGMGAICMAAGGAGLFIGPFLFLVASTNIKQNFQNGTASNLLSQFQDAMPDISAGTKLLTQKIKESEKKNTWLRRTQLVTLGLTALSIVGIAGTAIMAPAVLDPLATKAILGFAGLCLANEGLSAMNAAENGNLHVSCEIATYAKVCGHPEIAETLSKSGITVTESLDQRGQIQYTCTYGNDTPSALPKKGLIQELFNTGTTRKNKKKTPSQNTTPDNKGPQ